VCSANCGDRTLLKKKSIELEADINERFTLILVDGLHITLLHRDNAELLRSFLQLQSHDVAV
jgi:hypothetical protein